MGHTIKTKVLTIKYFTFAFLILVFFAIFYIRYHNPANIEKTCKSAHPLLVNNFRSCSLIEDVLSTLKENGYNPVILESSKYFGGIFREEFNTDIFEITNYQIQGDKNTGITRFKFINGRLVSIVHFPKETDFLFELYPQRNSEDVSVKHLSDFQGKKYMTWSNNHLEDYISWWIRRFS